MHPVLIGVTDEYYFFQLPIEPLGCTVHGLFFSRANVSSCNQFG